MSKLKIGSLVIHDPDITRFSFGPPYPALQSTGDWGTGVILFMWQDQAESEIMHDPDDVMVLFDCGERMVNINDLKLISR